jgi:hypothetical protein
LYHTNAEVKKMPRNSYWALTKKNWKEYFTTRSLLFEFIITSVLICIVLIYFSHFINTIEARNGVQLDDPILKLFNPADLSGFIFGIIYLSIIIGIINLVNDPSKLVFALQVYIVMIIIRIATLYLVPLNAPGKMIPLTDPLVQNIGTGQLLTKDLFFSGHTATMFLLYLVVINKKIKVIFFSCFIIVAVAVLIQHVHYTVDVIAAPFFTYAAYRIVYLIKEKYQF